MSIEEGNNRKGKSVRIALIGNPNCGKTSVFNYLTGTNQTTANYPGVTVESKIGFYDDNDLHIEVVDLPGIYSLTAFSMDEKVARDYLINNPIDLVVNILDAGNLERNMYLTVQLMELKVPFIMDINMFDSLESLGINLDIKQLESLVNTSVVTTIGNKGIGIDNLKRVIREHVLGAKAFRGFDINYGEDIESGIKELTSYLKQSLSKEREGTVYKDRLKWLSLKLLEGDKDIEEWLKNNIDDSIAVIESIKEIRERISNRFGSTIEVILAGKRYAVIQGIYHSAARLPRSFDTSISDKIDHVVTHSGFGFIVLGLVLFITYKVVFALGELPSELLQSLFSLLSTKVGESVSNETLQSLIRDGIISGVGGVLSFIPIIFLMFVFIGLLEDSGYMARMAFLLDRYLRKFGLHGSSMIAMIVAGGISGGCAVPAVLSARTIRNRAERLATISILPFFSCGAKLPVYGLLIAAFFTDYKALILLILTAISWIVALLSAILIRKTILKGESEAFIMELPPYRIPTAMNILIRSWIRVREYIYKAATVILLISVLFWGLMNYPKSETDVIKTEESIQITKYEHINKALMNSYAGQIGRGLTVISHYLGFDYRINIALLSGVAGKELVLSTLSSAYSLGESDKDISNLLGILKGKESGLTPLKAFSLLVFIMLYAPCLPTVIMIWKEAGLKWAAFTFLYSTVIAFVVSFLIYQGGLLIY